jgi:hypothetical protein
MFDDIIRRLQRIANDRDVERVHRNTATEAIRIFHAAQAKVKEKEGEPK